MDSTTVNLTKGLVAYYTFDGNANDKSANNHHGIVHGATLTTDRFGNINNAYIFNGVDTYIDLANTDTLNMLSGFTLATWCEFTASSEGSIVSKHVNYYYNGFTMSAYNCNANLTTDNSHYYIATTETYNDGNCIYSLVFTMELHYQFMLTEYLKYQAMQAIQLEMI